METMSEDFEPVASEKIEFENRKNENNDWSPSNSRPIKIPVSETKNEIVQSDSHPSSQITNL